MNIDSDLLKLLMEMGFLSTTIGRLGEAETIFNGVAQARPLSAYPQIGLGCVAMGRGDFSKAVDILRAAPAKERAEKDLCMGFLGMALKLGGYENECHTVLDELQSQGQNEVAIRMAGKLMRM